MVQKHCCIDLVTINSPLWMVTSIIFAYPNEGTWWNWAVAEVFKILVCQLPLPIQTFTIHQMLGNTIIMLPFRSNHCGACDTLCRQSAFFWSSLSWLFCFIWPPGHALLLAFCHLGFYTMVLSLQPYLGCFLGRLLLFLPLVLCLSILGPPLFSLCALP